jgi:hypothetical protein
LDAAVAVAQSAERKADSACRAVADVAADVKPLLDAARATKAAADAKAAADSKAAAENVRFDPSISSGVYTLSNGGKSVAGGVDSPAATTVGIVRELRSAARTGPRELVRIRCDSVDASGYAQMGFIPAARLPGSWFLGVVGTAGIGSNGTVYADGQSSSAPAKFEWKAGAVFRLSVDFTVRTFTAEVEGQTPVTVQWPQCPSRLYFAAAFTKGWAFTCS